MANYKKSILAIIGSAALAAVSAGAATVEEFWPSRGTGLDGSNGKKLAATLTIPDGPRENIPVVIFCHGFRDHKNTWIGQVLKQHLVNNGIAIMCFNFNAHGDGNEGNLSEGDFIDMTVPNEIEDAIKIYEYLRARSEFGKIAFAGHSQGGVVAAMAAGELGTEKISGLAIWAAAAVLKDDAIRGHCWVYHLADPLNPPAEGVDIGDGRRLGREFFLTAQKLPIYETAAKYKGGACVINGGSDGIVPVRYGERFHGVLAGSTFHLFPKDEHGCSAEAVAVGAKYLIRVLK